MAELDTRDEHARAGDPAHTIEHARAAEDAHTTDHGHGLVAHRDPHAEPSAEWGWHGTFPRAARIGGWALAATFLLMLIGNHRGRVEDIWLIGLTLLTVVVLVRDHAKRRTSWRR